MKTLDRGTGKPYKKTSVANGNLPLMDLKKITAEFT